MYGGNKVTMLVVMIIVVHNNDYNDINKNNQDNANNNNLNYQDINVCIKNIDIHVFKFKLPLWFLVLRIAKVLPVTK